MQHAHIDDVRLAYDTAGSNDESPVLLVMGYTVPGRAWQHQIPDLSTRHRVAWFDHRGCGQTEARAAPYTIGLLAEDARRLLDHLGWERAHVVGVSMGGMVAQELALSHPERVRSLGLIATHAGGRSPRLPPLPGLAQFLRANLSRGNRVEAVQRLLFPEPFLETCDREWLMEVLRADFGTPIPLRFRLSQLAAVMRHRTIHRLEEIAAPTLVVKPGQDLLVSPAESDRIARLIPNARLIEYADAGHGIIRQRAADLNQELLTHFAAAEG